MADSISRRNHGTNSRKASLSCISDGNIVSEINCYTTKYRGEPDGSVDVDQGRRGSGRMAPSTGDVSGGGGAGSLAEDKVDNSANIYGQTTKAPLASNANSAGKQRPYSLYDIGKKFYTLSEASMRKNHQSSSVTHSDVTKCNSVGKCNSIVEMAVKCNEYNSNTPGVITSAYTEIERFNRTLESEGVYMRNTNLRNSRNGHHYVAANGSVVVEGITYSTLPKGANSSEKLYGVASANNSITDHHHNGYAGGGGGGEMMHSNGGANGENGVSAASSNDTSCASNNNSSTTTMTKNGRIKRVRRTGFMALRVGRFTKNGEKKSNANNSTNNKNVIVNSDTKRIDDCYQSNSNGISSYANCYGGDNTVVNDLPHRSNSLDHLNFAEKRNLIASSLSLSEFLSNGAAGRGGAAAGGSGRGSRHLHGINVTSEGSSAEPVSASSDAVDAGCRKTPVGEADRGSGRKRSNDENNTIERKLERFGIGLVGMGSNGSNIRTLPSSNGSTSRPSSPLPLVGVSSAAILPGSLPTLAHPYDTNNIILLSSNNNNSSAPGASFVDSRLVAPILLTNTNNMQQQQQQQQHPNINNGNTINQSNQLYGLTTQTPSPSGGGVFQSTSALNNSHPVWYPNNNNSSSAGQSSNAITSKSKSTSLSLSDLLSATRSSKGTLVSGALVPLHMCVRCSSCCVLWLHASIAGLRVECYQ